MGWSWAGWWWVRRERKKKRRRKRRQIVDVAVAIALSWPLSLRLLLALCLALPRSKAESTEDITSDARGSTFVISQNSRPRQNALANKPTAMESEQGKPKEAKRRNECIHKNTLRQTVLFVAARSTSTAPASSKHRGKSTPRRAKATPPCNLEGMENNAATASQRCFFPPAGGRKKNNADRRLSRLATTLLTTKSGSRMPNWIALTRLTGADEYGKRSIVAMMGNRKRRSGCRRHSFFFGGASSPPLLLRCQTPQRALSRAPRACAEARASRRERNGHRKIEKCLVFSFFSSSFAFLRFCLLFGVGRRK